MAVKVKLTFKSINSVRIKNYLLIFKKNMEKYLLSVGVFIKLFIFITYL